MVAHTHSAVPVPGRPLLVVTEEIYPAGASTGCPWGHARLVDITDPSRPAVAGEYLLPENRQPCTGARRCPGCGNAVDHAGGRSAQ